MSVYTQTISAASAAQARQLPRQNPANSAEAESNTSDQMNPEDVLAAIDSARARLIGDGPFEIPPEMKITDPDEARQKTQFAVKQISQTQNLAEIHDLSMDRVMELIS